MKFRKRRRWHDDRPRGIGRFVVEPGDAELVPFGDFRARSPIVATIEDPPIRVTIAIEDGQPTCTAVERSPGGPPLTGNLLRTLRIERITRAIAMVATFEEQSVPRDQVDPLRQFAFDEDAAGNVRITLPVVGRSGGLQELQKLVGHRPRRGSRLSDELLEHVARIYREAARSGDDPTAAVARTIPVARSTAGRYVGRARERGLLPPTTPGRARA